MTKTTNSKTTNSKTTNSKTEKSKPSIQKKAPRQATATVVPISTSQYSISPPDSKLSSPSEFIPKPRTVIERSQNDDQKNEYINKAMKHIKSIQPAINEDYFLSGPTYQKLYRINKFLYDNNLSNARTKLTYGIYGGVQEKEGIKNLINASEHIGYMHYDSNSAPLQGPVPSFYRGGPTIDRMRPRPPSPSSPSPIPEGRKKLREEQEDPNPSLISPVPYPSTSSSTSNPRNVTHRLFQYPNSNKTPTPTPTPSPTREIIDLTLSDNIPPTPPPIIDLTESHSDHSAPPSPTTLQGLRDIETLAPEEIFNTGDDRNWFDRAQERLRKAAREKKEEYDKNWARKKEYLKDLDRKRKRKKGGKTKKRKWSLKYKRSINCKKPKGFSQKQYCKRVNKTRRKK